MFENWPDGNVFGNSSEISSDLLIFAFLKIIEENLRNDGENILKNIEIDREKFRYNRSVR